MSLYPTPTRLKLLQAVVDGEVYRDHAIGTGWVDEWDDVARTPRIVRVNSRVAELEREGWVALATQRWGSDDRRPWELTPAGREVLAAGGGAP